MFLKVETVGQDRKVPISTYFETIFLVTIPPWKLLGIKMWKSE